MKSKAYYIITSIIECLILFTLPTIVTIMAWNLRMPPLFVWYIISYDHDLGYGYEMRTNQNPENIQGG